MNSKIILCIPRRSAYRQPIVKSLNHPGFKIKEFDFRKGNVTTGFLGLLSNLFFNKSDCIKQIIHKLIQKQLIQSVQYWQPQILLVIKGHEIETRTVKTIKQMGVITINWYPDWLASWDWIKKNCQNYSFFVSTCTKLNTEVKKIHPHAFYLPSASDPDPNFYSGPEKYNISFIGNYTPRREEYFKHIADLGLRIWGYPTWSVSTLNKIVSRQVSVNTAKQLIRESKICINILTGNDKFEPIAINNRTFESLGAGTFLLVKRDKIILKYFEDGKDLVTFTTPSDLRKKAIYYLKHDKEREKIAKHGWYTVKNHHTYEIRFKQLFKLIKYENHPG